MIGIGEDPAHLWAPKHGWISRLRRRVVLYKRVKSNRLLGVIPGDVCPNPNCQLYRSNKAVGVVKEDEFGNKTDGSQLYCQEWEGGCGESWVSIARTADIRRANAVSNQKRVLTIGKGSHKRKPQTTGPSDEYIKQLQERRMRGDYS